MLAEGSLPQQLLIMNTFSAFLFPTRIMDKPFRTCCRRGGAGGGQPVRQLFILNRFQPSFGFPIHSYTPSAFVAGVVVLGEGSLPRQLFMNLVWLVGTYLFAAVLGVITGDIMERIQVRA